MRFQYLVLIFTIYICQEAHPALFNHAGEPIHDAYVQSDDAVAWTFPALDKSPHLTGVVYVYKPDGGSGSGALIKLSDDPSAPAYILTAGHVASPRDYHQSLLEVDIVHGIPDEGTHVTFNAFLKSPDGWRFNRTVKEISFAVMNGTDLGLYELDMTVLDLEERGIRPFKLSDTLPADGQRVRAVGIPGAINWITQSEGLVGPAGLTYNAMGHQWPHSFSLAASIIDGMSGSPVLNDRNEIIGVVNAAGNRSNSFQSILHLKNLFDKAGRFHSSGPPSRRPARPAATKTENLNCGTVLTTN